MSHYAAYLKEREGKSIIEIDEGFIVYKLLGEECYIAEAYIVPSKRREHICSDLERQVELEAKKAGCKWLTCSVWMKDPGASRNMQGILNTGYKFVHQEGDSLYFARSI